MKSLQCPIYKSDLYISTAETNQNDRTKILLNLEKNDNIFLIFDKIYRIKGYRCESGIVNLEITFQSL